MFDTLPTPAQVTWTKPKGDDALLAEFTKAMLFPQNQPGWRIAGHYKRGFNVRLERIVEIADIRRIEIHLLFAGWRVDQIKYRNGRTYVTLVDMSSERRDQQYYFTRPVGCNRSPRQ